MYVNLPLQSVCELNSFPRQEIFVSGVMFCLLPLCVVDSEFKSQLGQTKDYEICICCFYPKQAALRSKSKDTNTFTVEGNLKLANFHVYGVEHQLQ